eukprot:5162385-Amphidinium_carterae.1
MRQQNTAELQRLLGPFLYAEISTIMTQWLREECPSEYSSSPEIALVHTDIAPSEVEDPLQL